MGHRLRERPSGPKCIALVGPFASGKSTLFDALLARSLAGETAPISSQSSPTQSPEAIAHEMSVECRTVSSSFLGEHLTLVDCPGGVDFAHLAEPALRCADAAVVVVDATDFKLPALQLILHRLDTLGLPRMLFLNKMDRSNAGVRDTLKTLQEVSSIPLLLRQIPLRKNGIVIGSIDLALERAYVYREHAPSEVAPIPDDDRAREVEARFSMLETLADHDDQLMEQLLEEIEPPRDAIFDDLAADLREGSVTPVLIGAAEKGNGILRLLKAIRHDVPDIAATRERLGVEEDEDPLLQVFQTVHSSHGGKISFARCLAGKVTDGVELGEAGKVSGLYRMEAGGQQKITSADAGESVVLGKLENAATGDTLTPKSRIPADAEDGYLRPAPVHRQVVRPVDRKDEAKLSLALQKLVQEDPGLTMEQLQESSETILSGQGDIHLKVAAERLSRRFQIDVELAEPSIPYRETIRTSTTQRARHKKQSGGHGQFADIVVDIAPLPRGAGFIFNDTISGGVVPKQYIPSVETGVREALKEGPLGFPVVDVSVTLKDGSYHSVDSSDMAFQVAGRAAMKEGLPACKPVLLEPIQRICVFTPNEQTARVTAIISQRRGQILGFNPRDGWDGWDEVEALMPEAEMRGLIVELRSATAGVASYTARFDHLAELTGKQAEAAQAKAGKAA
ncbi:elongation factor G [Nitratireductor sp. CH_MIT9313-5]|uniref:elongation factor G n=1 Tax=Nitratireductor sp. CH_MIT9313-5 TaxID=3107764 RepID=UPI0030092FBF